MSKFNISWSTPGDTYDFRNPGDVAHDELTALNFQKAELEMEALHPENDDILAEVENEIALIESGIHQACLRAGLRSCMGIRAILKESISAKHCKLEKEPRFLN